MEQKAITKIVIEAQRGSNEAFAALYEQYHQSVYNVAMRYTKDRTLAEDVVQETFIEVINTIGKLKEPAAFSHWLLKIANHQCTRYYRRKEVLHEELAEDTEDGFSVLDTLEESNAEFIPDAALDEKEFRQTIHNMLDELPDVQSAALYMFYFDGLSLQQIAQVQGVPLNTANTRLSRGRKAMQKTVEEYEKKHDVRLHSVALLPLLTWLFQGTQETMSVEAGVAVAKGIAAATGVSFSTIATGTAATAATATAATGVAAGIGAKIAALPMVTKVIAAVVAALIVVTPPAAIVLHNNLSKEDPRDSVSQGQTVTPEDTTEPESDVLRIPQGCQYTVAKTGAVLNAGMPFPKIPETGDIFRDPIAGYEYAYNSEVILDLIYTETGSHLVQSFGKDEDLFGWCVTVIDRSQESYGEILSSICGEPVKSMKWCFYRCQNMIEAPEIPASVITLESCFKSCISLLRSPMLPYGLVDISFAFKNASALHSVQPIPATVLTSDWAFAQCVNLTGTIRIDATLDKVEGLFWGTEKPITIYGLSQNLKEIAGTSQKGNVAYRTDILPVVDDTGTRQNEFSQLSLEERIQLNRFLYIFCELGGIPNSEEDMFKFALIYADTHVESGQGDSWADAVPENALQETAQSLFGQTLSNDAMPSYIWYENGVYYTDIAFTEKYLSMYLIVDVYKQQDNTYGIVFEDYSFVKRIIEYEGFTVLAPAYDTPPEEWYGFAPEDAKMCEDLEYSYTGAVVVQVITQPDGTETYQIIVE